MIFIKYISLIVIFLLCYCIGTMISKKYKSRLLNLKEMKNVLNTLKTKIKFTYKPLGEIFNEISEKTNFNKDNEDYRIKAYFFKLLKVQKLLSASDIFRIANENLEMMNIEEAWKNAVDMTSESLKFNKEDIEIIKQLGNMLGKTDLDGQTNEINLTLDFLDRQITEADEMYNKNSKMYRTLGTIAGLTVMIILI